MGGWWRWALVSPDGVSPSRMVGVSASVNLPLHDKVQKFFSGTGSPGWSRKKGHKTVVVVLWHSSVCAVTVLSICQCVTLVSRVKMPAHNHCRHTPHFPQIDIIGAMVIVWRVREKIIRSVLCNIVCNNCAQCNAHTYEQI